MNTKKINRIINFCTPSLLSGAIVVVASVMALFIGSYSYLQKSGVLYEFILGKNNSPELVESSQNSIAHLSFIVFGNPTLNKILFFLFWMLIGLVVYLFVSGIRRGVLDAKSDIEQMKYVHADKYDLKYQLVKRASVHLIGVIAILIYGSLFLSVLWPYSRRTSQAGLDSLGQPVGWLRLLFATLILMFCLHIFTILIRIATTRSRLFGKFEV